MIRATRVESDLEMLLAIKWFKNKVIHYLDYKDMFNKDRNLYDSNEIEKILNDIFMQSLLKDFSAIVCVEDEIPY